MLRCKQAGLVVCLSACSVDMEVGQVVAGARRDSATSSLSSLNDSAREARAHRPRTAGKAMVTSNLNVFLCGFKKIPCTCTCLLVCTVCSEKRKRKKKTDSWIVGCH